MKLYKSPLKIIVLFITLSLFKFYSKTLPSDYIIAKQHFVILKKFYNYLYKLYQKLNPFFDYFFKIIVYAFNITIIPALKFLSPYIQSSFIWISSFKIPFLIICAVLGVGITKSAIARNMALIQVSTNVGCSVQATLATPTPIEKVPYIKYAIMFLSFVSPIIFSMLFLQSKGPETVVDAYETYTSAVVACNKAKTYCIGAAQKYDQLATYLVSEYKKNEAFFQIAVGVYNMTPSGACAPIHDAAELIRLGVTKYGRPPSMSVLLSGRPRLSAMLLYANVGFTALLACPMFKLGLNVLEHMFLRKNPLAFCYTLLQAYVESSVYAPPSVDSIMQNIEPLMSALCIAYFVYCVFRGVAELQNKTRTVLLQQICDTLSTSKTNVVGSISAGPTRLISSVSAGSTNIFSYLSTSRTRVFSCIGTSTSRLVGSVRANTTRLVSPLAPNKLFVCRKRASTPIIYQV